MSKSMEPKEPFFALQASLGEDCRLKTTSSKGSVVGYPRLDNLYTTSNSFCSNLHRRRASRCL